MEAAQETITSGTETQETASASSPEMSYPRDPVPTRGIARTEAQNPEDSKAETQGKGTEAETKTDAETKTATTETKDKPKEEVAAEVKATEKTTTEKESEEDKLDRFDKHPRFKELNEKAKKVPELERQVKELVGRINEMTATKEKEPEVSMEELADLFDDNPAEAIPKILELAKTQAKNELKSELNEKDTLQTRQQQLDEFMSQFPDFKEKWDNNELAQFVDQNPLHSPLSAYLLMDRNNLMENHKAEMEKAVAEAVEAARKEEQEKADKKLKGAEANFKAKKSIKIIDDTPGDTSNDSKSDIRNATGHSLTERIVGNLQRLRAGG